eukprot:m.172233 g.172233  ORF g.172233 m.172233 type:complete len:77 (-) comp31673_c0_seq1:390-620(-)
MLLRFVNTWAYCKTIRVYGCAQSMKCTLVVLTAQDVIPTQDRCGQATSRPILCEATNVKLTRQHKQSTDNFFRVLK